MCFLFFSVTFWKTKFTMTCPGEDSDLSTVEWYKNDKKEEHQNKEYEQDYNSDRKGLYHCVYDDPGSDSSIKLKYYFYVRGKGE